MKKDNFDSEEKQKEIEKKQKLAEENIQFLDDEKEFLLEKLKNRKFPRKRSRLWWLSSPVVIIIIILVAANRSRSSSSSINQTRRQPIYKRTYQPIRRNQPIKRKPFRPYLVGGRTYNSTFEINQRNTFNQQRQKSKLTNLLLAQKESIIRL